MDATEMSVQQLSQRTEGSSSRAYRRRFSPYSPTQTTSSTPSSYTSSLPPTQRRASATHLDDQALYGYYLPTPASEGTPPGEPSPGWSNTSPYPSPHIEDFASGPMNLLTTYASPDCQFVPAPDILSSNDNLARTGILNYPSLVSSPQQTFGADAAAFLNTPPSELSNSSIPHPFGVSLAGRNTNIASGLYRYNEPEPRVDADEEDSASVLSISTAFHPGSLPHLPPADVIIVSCDETLFYVHAATLVSVAPQVFHDVLQGQAPGITSPASTDQLSTAATTSFEAASWVVQRYPHAGTSGPHTWLKMDLFPADELNIMLHAFYNTSCVVHQPSIDVIEQALAKMANPLSLDVASLASPSSELFAYLIGLAPLYPLRIYTIGARYEIHDLAVKASSHLLSLSLSSLTDNDAVRIGAVYLKKLVLLHVSRAEALRELLLKPPHPHPPTRTCSFKNQKTMETLWASVVVNLAWDVRPDLSTAVLQRALSPVTDRLECQMCCDSLDKRIADIIKSWASVPHCID